MGPKKKQRANKRQREYSPEVSEPQQKKQKIKTQEKPDHFQESETDRQKEFIRLKDLGNADLTKAGNTNINDGLKREKLDQASKYYAQAMKIAGSDNIQKSMIFKNMITVNKVYCKIAQDDGLKLFYFDQQIQNLNLALYFGLSVQDQTWIKNIFDRAPSLMNQLKEILKCQTSKFKSIYMEKIFQKLNKTNSKLVIAIAWQLSKAFQRQAVQSQDINVQCKKLHNLKKHQFSVKGSKIIKCDSCDKQIWELNKYYCAYCDHCICEQCYYKQNRNISKAMPLINKASQYFGWVQDFIEFHPEFKTKEKFRNLKYLIYQDSQRIKFFFEQTKAQDQYNKAIFESEKLDMDYLQDSLDSYNRACQNITGVDIELEAQTQFEIGKIYNHSLKNKLKARNHLIKCLQLAASLHPIDFSRFEWFKEASALLQVIRDEIEKGDPHNQEKALIIEKLKPEIDFLQQQRRKGAKEFLKCLQTDKFWPKDYKLIVLEEKDLKENMKQCIKKFYLPFHPDKQHGQTIELQVLREQITYMLNDEYERYKQ